MITKKLVRSYKKYNGDIDAWSRSIWSRDTSKYDEWYLISSIIQDIHLVLRKSASDDFERTLIRKIEENCDSSETIELLLELVNVKKWW